MIQISILYHLLALINYSNNIKKCYLKCDVKVEKFPNGRIIRLGSA